MTRSKNTYREYFGRNIGFISEEEQKKLSRASIGIAGAGGDGGLLAERLTRFGVGKIVLADPEKFEVNNANRQFGANQKSFGKNKAEIVAQELKLINPYLKINVYKKGLNTSNVNKFVKKSDVIIDEIEYAKPEISVMLATEARKENKYLFTAANIGWGASMFCFSPKGMTFEKYFQYNKKDKSIDEMKYMPKTPRYFDQKLISEIISKKRPVPSLSSSVGLVAALLSSQVILFLLGKKRPAVAPKCLFIDFCEDTNLFRR